MDIQYFEITKNLEFNSFSKKLTSNKTSLVLLFQKCLILLVACTLFSYKLRIFIGTLDITNYCYLYILQIFILI